MTAEELVEQYIAARRKKERLAREKADAERAFARAEAALADHFVQNGMQSVRKGALFSLKSQFRVSFTGANFQPIKDWLDARGCELSDYVQEKLAYTPTKSLIEKVYKDEGEFALPGGSGETVGLNTDPAISVTGWKEHYQEVDDA